jgi:hypothetical protein
MADKPKVRYVPSINKLDVGYTYVEANKFKFIKSPTIEVTQDVASVAVKLNDLVSELEHRGLIDKKKDTENASSK